MQERVKFVNPVLSGQGLEALANDVSHEDATLSEKGAIGHLLKPLGQGVKSTHGKLGLSTQCEILFSIAVTSVVPHQLFSMSMLAPADPVAETAPDSKSLFAAST